MIKKLFAAFTCTVLAVLLFAGCQSAPASTAATGSNGNTIFGKVTSVDGNKITIALAENQFGGQNQNGQGNYGPRTSGQRPQGSFAPRTSGGQRPQASGGAQRGNGTQGGGFGLNLTGESKTINVTDSTAITTGGYRQNQSAPAASLSDIKEGSIVMVTLSGDNATAITIMGTGNSGQNGNGASPTPGETPSAGKSENPGTPPPPSASPLPSGSTTPSIGAQVSF
jgi:hypothetical protein